MSADSGVFALVNGLRDPRDPRGRQYPLGSVLLIALCAIASRFDSFRAMGQWAAVAPPTTLGRLGLRRCGAFALVKAPSADTIRRVVNAVLPGGLEQLLRAFQEKASVVAVDGKCLRGSRDAAGQAVMVLGAMLQDGTLVAQQKVADKGSEITGFAALLAALELEDAVVVADALHTQREHARVLVEEFGAHYAFPVKRNQMELWKACRKVPWERVRATFRSTARAHGRIDTRVVEVVSFAGLDFPYARQVARITRYRTVRASGKRSRETVYVITDLPAGAADPQRIGEIVQSEWGIENKIHYVRDVTFGEDASRIRTGHGPQNMATLRSVVMNFLRQMGTSIADARRQLALAPHTAPLDLFGIPCDLHVHA
ncbi:MULTISPECIES: ISAs1 family transposase [unclassified Streptomyces]|uniref:ISAs1 family transposase n=1 Tax=unclassified Streptomyces TaxID=2593676 RepID=UPI0038084CF9